jgi:hypothetical protein
MSPSYKWLQRSCLLQNGGLNGVGVDYSHCAVGGIFFCFSGETKKGFCSSGETKNS